MLVEVSQKEYRKHFPTDASPFISESFISLNELKQDKILRLMKQDESSIGLLVGLKDGVLRSPFSAPFGGFHYNHEYMFYDQVYNFLSDLKEYVADNGFKQVIITLPPVLYQVNMNAKFVNAFIQLGYTMEKPDINNWVNLKKFDGVWVKSVVAQNCRKAVKHGLIWSVATEKKEMEETYGVICNNREEQGRKIFMKLEDILEVKKVFPVDFFQIREKDGNIVGASIFYRGHEKIVQGVFMGDDMEKRNLGIMNYMYFNIYQYYKEMGFEYIDLGASSLYGEPNQGLIRFKELHNCNTSLRITFTWKPES
jgi:hypothetical protein